jgi:hypothetical protein
LLLISNVELGLNGLLIAGINAKGHQRGEKENGQR